MSTANPLPLDAAARDELRAKAEAANDGYWPTEEAFRDDGYIEVAAQFLAACRPERILALLAAVERGEADTARLDWMQARAAELSTADYPRVWDVTPEGGAYHFTPLGGYGMTDVREAIDTARAHPPIQETDDAE